MKSFINSLFFPNTKEKVNEIIFKTDYIFNPGILFENSYRYNIRCDCYYWGGIIKRENKKKFSLNVLLKTNYDKESFNKFLNTNEKVLHNPNLYFITLFIEKIDEDTFISKCKEDIQEKNNNNKKTTGLRQFLFNKARQSLTIYYDKLNERYEINNNDIKFIITDDLFNNVEKGWFKLLSLRLWTKEEPDKNVPRFIIPAVTKGLNKGIQSAINVLESFSDDDLEKSIHNERELYYRSIEDKKESDMTLKPEMTTCYLKIFTKFQYLNLVKEAFSYYFSEEELKGLENFVTKKIKITKLASILEMDEDTLYDVCDDWNTFKKERKTKRRKISHRYKYF